MVLVVFALDFFDILVSRVLLKGPLAASQTLAQALRGLALCECWLLFKVVEKWHKT